MHYSLLLVLINHQDDLVNEDANNAGATYAPWNLGSDKTTVSVGTGNSSFYPLYGSSALLHNDVRRSNPNAVVLIALLPIPKGMCNIHVNSDMHSTNIQRIENIMMRIAIVNSVGVYFMQCLRKYLHL